MEMWHVNRPRLPKTLAWEPKVLGLVLLLALPLALRAQYTCATNNDGTLTITRYAGPGGVLTVPSALNGLPVTGIGEEAFTNCSSLLRVSISNGIRSLGSAAFSGCSGLTNVALPKSVTNLSDFVFGYCTNLVAITVDALNPSFCSVDGVLFDKQQTRLLECPLGKTGSFTLPGSVTSLGHWAFATCVGLTSLSLPDSLRLIPDGAFASCSGLTNITLPQVVSIGWGAFFGCSSLHRVSLPASLTNLQDYAFADCQKLAAVYFAGDAPLIGVSVFAADTNATGYYPPASTGWGPTLGELPTVPENRYQPVSATYNGLFYASDGAWYRSAGAFSLSTTARGKFTGLLMLDGRRYSLRGALDAWGHAQVTLLRRNASALQVTLQVTGQIAGSVTGGSGTDTWTAVLAGDQAGFNLKSSPAPQAGHYTLVLPGDLTTPAQPGGTGCGTLSVDKAGRVRLSGALADGTKFTQAALLSGEGVWPLYASLYRGQGTVLGWLSFTNTPATDLSGALHWFKPGAATSQYYPDGILLESSAVGSHYTRPSAGAKVLTLNEASVVLSGAGLPQDLTNYISIGTHSRVTSTNKTRLTFTASTGAFQGSVPNPAAPAGKPILCHGVVLQNQNSGWGWFLGTNQCGEVYLGE
jgi:hypothetical protein